MAAAKKVDDEVKADSPMCVNLQILRASHYVLKVYDDAYRPFGVRATQMPVLGVISRRGPVSIKEIAEEVASERSVMSRKLQVMEANGWIQQDAATSGKEKTFVLTDRGRELINQMMPVRLDVQRRLMDRLSKEEQDLLMSLCGKLQQGT